ncbi:sulfatase family protein [Chondrinema litorale]|uniref:sulfatase family protein n=1 Tax=Chondrinema litorale TaxID=2994555 RepID=UPI00254327B8|nr:sulfatase-like hydrolase/transferase [Chondrinema litorale]UZR97534.1 sulfatase-like hydrolase/transferase [Chondrinema litorale]
MKIYLSYPYYLLCFLMFASCNRQREAVVKPPNIIYIYTDQQHANMMSCAGNKWVKTPAMDYIANNGIRFTRAYTTNPVCSPARISMITGRFPSYFDDEKGNAVRENWGANRVSQVSEEVWNSTIANYAKQAGYDIIFGGKEHLPKPLRPDTLGFTDISDNERNILAQEAASYIKGNHEKPYFMIVSLINPHDICYMAIRDFAETAFDSMLVNKGVTEIAELDKAMQIPEGVSKEEFYAKYCPPLPPNYEVQIGEPQALKKLLTNRNFRNNARMNYSDEDWRMHRWAYCRLAEVVDNDIQVILDALKEQGAEENTLVMLSSDHGEMDAAHRMEHKSTMYEEATNVPFLAMWKGQIPSGQVDSVHLVSNGLDLLPTLCDYMGVAGKADPRGKSLRPLMEGSNTDWRKYLGVESEVGKMVVSEDGYKYLRYDFTGIEEQLLDLNKDPFETTHFTDSAGYAEKLADLKNVYQTEWFPEESN